MKRFSWIVLATLLLGAACSPAATSPSPTTISLAPTPIASPTRSPAPATAAPTRQPTTVPPTRQPTRVIPSSTPQPTPTITPTPYPILQLDDRTIAWLWLPKAHNRSEDNSFLWKIGVPQDVAPGDVVAINGRGAQQTLGSDVVNVYDRPSSSPLFAQPIEPTNHVGIINPVTKQIVSARYAGDVLSPDTKHVASLVISRQAISDFPSTTAIINTTTGISRTFSIFNDIPSMGFARRLHAWGRHTVFGSMHDRWIHVLWWFNPDQRNPKIESFNYSGETVHETFAINPDKDLLAYTSLDNPQHTRQLVVQNTFTGKKTILGEVSRCSNLSISSNDRYVVCLCNLTELRLYDLSTRTYKVIGTRIIPDTTQEYLWPAPGFFVPTSISQWSNDSKYMLILSADNDKSIDTMTLDTTNITLPYTRHALVFRASGGAQVGDVALPNFVGSLRLTNDLKIIMVVYDRDQARLVMHDVQTGAQSQPVPLGRNTPLIVYVPDR